MGNNTNRFTQEQIQWLKDNYKNYRFKELTVKFNQLFQENKSVSWIRHFVGCKRHLGLKSIFKAPFSSEEISFIKKYAPLMTRKDFYKFYCEHFGNLRTSISVNKKAKDLKALRTKETISYARYKNRDSKFPIGHIMERSWAKYIKISNAKMDKNQNNLQNYMPLSQYVLEQHGIILKENQRIKFKDGNIKNCDFDNLIVVSASTMGYMSKKQLWGKGEITEAALKVGELLDKIKEIEEGGK